MDVRPTAIPGCFELQLVFRGDIRGRYVKVADPEVFGHHGMATAFAQTHHATFGRGVLRGMHVVRPPLAQDTLVYCVLGEVFAAVLDLREGSPAFRRSDTLILSDLRANMLYVPAGVAHGFYVLSERATVVRHVTTACPPDDDAGVLWNSADIPWPDREPLLADTDLALPPLPSFESPFVYTP